MRAPSSRSPFDPFFKRSVAIPDDAVTQHKGAEGRDDQWGMHVMRQPGRGYQGTIVDRNADTHTYTVSFSIGDGIVSKEGMGRLLQDPGDKRMLPIGARVAISEEFGEPLIVGVLAYTSGRDDNENRISISGESGSGGNDPLEQRESAANYRTKNTPRDMGPNDWAQVGEEGNLVGVLGGGVNIIKSSGMSQIRTHLLNDLIELISRNFKHVSDMGVSEIKNEGGRVSWTFRGGADQLTECGADQENWTIRIDLGAEGDMFRFELTQPDGGTNFRLHVNNEGGLTIYSAKDSDETVGTDRRQLILGNRSAAVKGNDDEVVQGNQTQHIQGNRDTVVSSSDTQTVGNDKTVSVQRHLTETIGGKHEEKVVGGNVLLMKPGDLARETVLNASWDVDIGNPLSGASPAALASYHLKTFTGNIKNEVKIAGNIDYSTLLGNATLETVAGIATLKSALGVANVDGTTVNLGPVAASLANPLVKGTLYSSAFGAYTAANMGGLSPAIAATSTLLGVLSPLNWTNPAVMVPAMVAWCSAVTACFTALLGANAALAAALPTTLSTKSFTA